MANPLTHSLNVIAYCNCTKPTPILQGLQLEHDDLPKEPTCSVNPRSSAMGWPSFSHLKTLQQSWLCFKDFFFYWNRNMESQNWLGWKTPLRSPSPTVPPALPGPAITHVPKCHICMSCTWYLLRSPGESWIRPTFRSLFYQNPTCRSGFRAGSTEIQPPSTQSQHLNANTIGIFIPILQTGYLMILHKQTSSREAENKAAERQSCLIGVTVRIFERCQASQHRVYPSWVSLDWLTDHTKHLQLTWA